jgi:hypothetical protein
LSLAAAFLIAASVAWGLLAGSTAAGLAGLDASGFGADWQAVIKLKVSRAIAWFFVMIMVGFEERFESCLKR